MSSAATGGEMVGALAVLMIFGMPIVYLIVNRYYAHHERIEMIRRGITPPPDARWARRMERSGFTQGTPPQMYYDPSAQYPDRMLRKGVTMAMIGFALVIGLSFIHPGQAPGAWLLFGLIPLFVGIAQIILALMSGAQFGSWTLPGPTPVQRGSMPGQPPPEGPYAWRPGPTTELEPPVRPPDTRP